MLGKGVGSLIVYLAISLSECSSSNGRHPHRRRKVIMPIVQRSTDFP